MKRAAFYLVAGVISIQLLIVSGVLFGCFRSGDDKCTGEKVGEFMLYITTQSFALYAAEK
jgi:hypothetical protein